MLALGGSVPLGTGGVNIGIIAVVAVMEVGRCPDSCMRGLRPRAALTPCLQRRLRHRWGWT